MTKIIMPSLLTMAFSVVAFSQTIVRTAELNVKNSRYTVEVQIAKTQQGAGIDSKVSKASYGDPEIGDHGFYRCEDTVSIQGDVEMTYILKNAAGRAIGRQTVKPLLTSTRSTDADEDSVCKPLFPTRVEASFSSVGQFVDFKTAEGLLSVSANFSADVISDESYVAQVDEKSLTELRTFLNNSNGLNASLIDPTNPPVEDEDAYCAAHPYDCN